MSSQPQPAQVEKDEEATLAFGVGRLPALLAALGFSLFVWAFIGDGYPFISALATMMGFITVKVGMNLPQHGKAGWYAAGLLLVGIFGSLFVSYAIVNPLPDHFARTVPGVLTQQAVMAAALCLFFRRVMPVKNPRLQHG